MPELPEVETIATDLEKNLKGTVVKDFKVLNETTKRAQPLVNYPLAIFKRKLLGGKIEAVSRRAKMIVIKVGRSYLLVHLKMTGQLVYRACGDKRCQIVAGGHPIVGVGQELPNKFTRAVFDFGDGSSLYFNDVRRFGWLRLLDENEWHAYEKTLGMEPLSREFDLAAFRAVLSRKKKTAIKQALLDQKHLVGIGNIYADEAMFMAGIKPTRQVSSLTGEETKKLWQAIPKVLRLAIKHRGTSFNDYRDASGEKGNFLKYLNVYGRSGEKCKRCGSTVKKIMLGGRGTHWCDSCQF